MGFFGAGHGWCVCVCVWREGWGRGGANRHPIPKISHTYPTMIKLGTVITYLKKIQKIYKSRDTRPEFC